METIQKLIICLSSFLLLSILSSCEDGPDYNVFLIQVHEVQVPENIKINEPFEIELHGTIGTNGCYQFSKFETETQGNNIIISAWGKINKNSKICPEVMVYLDDEKLSYTIKEKGTYTIKVKQADGSLLDKQISVDE